MTRRSTAAATALVLTMLTACSAGEGTFDAGGGPDVTCMQHQPNTPGPAYQPGEGANTAQIMQVLRYYTANGRKPYCDDEPPTGRDLQWAELYVRLGADRTNVAAILTAPNRRE